jgi:hypothetical protein
MSRSWRLRPNDLSILRYDLHKVARTSGQRW